MNVMFSAYLAPLLGLHSLGIQDNHWRKKGERTGRAKETKREKEKERNRSIV